MLIHVNLLMIVNLLIIYELNESHNVDHASQIFFERYVLMVASKKRCEESRNWSRKFLSHRILNSMYKIYKLCTYLYNYVHRIMRYAHIYMN